MEASSAPVVWTGIDDDGTRQAIRRFGQVRVDYYDRLDAELYQAFHGHAQRCAPKHRQKRLWLSKTTAGSPSQDHGLDHVGHLGPRNM